MRWSCRCAAASAQQGGSRGPGEEALFGTRCGTSRATPPMFLTPIAGRRSLLTARGRQAPTERAGTQLIFAVSHGAAAVSSRSSNFLLMSCDGRYCSPTPRSVRCPPKSTELLWSRFSQLRCRVDGCRCRLRAGRCCTHQERCVGRSVGLSEGAFA